MADEASDMKMKSRVMDAEGTPPQHMPPSERMENKTARDNNKRLRKDPTLAMDLSSLETAGSSRIVDTNDGVLDTKMSCDLEGFALNHSDPWLRRNETIVMLDTEQSVRKPLELDLKMSTINSEGPVNTLMSIESKKSFMDITGCADKEMKSFISGTEHDVEMSIKKEPSDMDSNLAGTLTLETDMSIKTEPSFFGSAFDDDDSMPLALQGITSDDKIKIEPDGSVDEDGVNCASTLVYSSRGGSVYSQRLVVKLKRKASKYGSRPAKRKKVTAKPKPTVLECDTSLDDVDMLVKCEPMSDTDMDFDGGSCAGRKKRMTKAYRTEKEKRQRVCGYCHNVFSSTSSMKRHQQRMHTEGTLSFTCSFCDAKFARLLQLRAHEKFHTGEKTFPCPVCKLVFTRACHVKVHMRKHTGERPYTCETAGCHATFRTSSNLNRHLKKHSGLRPFECTVCDANFYQSSHLVSHVRKHTGERPFRCTQCEATFRQLTHLYRHKFKHSGVKPFQCTTCGLRFAEKCGLKKHVEVHDRGEVANSCGIKRSASHMSSSHKHEGSCEGRSPKDATVSRDGRVKRIKVKIEGLRKGGSQKDAAVSENDNVSAQ